MMKNNLDIQSAKPITISTSLLDTRINKKGYYQFIEKRSRFGNSLVFKDIKNLNLIDTLFWNFPLTEEHIVHSGIKIDEKSIILNERTIVSDCFGKQIISSSFEYGNVKYLVMRSDATINDDKFNPSSQRSIYKFSILANISDEIMENGGINTIAGFGMGGFIVSDITFDEDGLTTDKFGGYIDLNQLLNKFSSQLFIHYPSFYDDIIKIAFIKKITNYKEASEYARTYGNCKNDRESRNFLIKSLSSIMKTSHSVIGGNVFSTVLIDYNDAEKLGSNFVKNWSKIIYGGSSHKNILRNFISGNMVRGAICDLSYIKGIDNGLQVVRSRYNNNGKQQIESDILYDGGKVISKASSQCTVFKEGIKGGYYSNFQSKEVMHTFKQNIYTKNIINSVIDGTLYIGEDYFCSLTLGRYSDDFSDPTDINIAKGLDQTPVFLSVGKFIDKSENYVGKFGNFVCPLGLVSSVKGTISALAMGIRYGEVGNISPLISSIVQDTENIHILTNNTEDGSYTDGNKYSLFSFDLKEGFNNNPDKDNMVDNGKVLRNVNKINMKLEKSELYDIVDVSRVDKSCSYVVLKNRKLTLGGDIESCGVSLMSRIDKTLLIENDNTSPVSDKQYIFSNVTPTSNTAEQVFSCKKEGNKLTIISTFQANISIGNGKNIEIIERNFGELFASIGKFHSFYHDGYIFDFYYKNGNITMFDKRIGKEVIISSNLIVKDIRFLEDGNDSWMFFKFKDGYKEGYKILKNGEYQFIPEYETNKDSYLIPNNIKYHFVNGLGITPFSENFLKKSENN